MRGTHRLGRVMAPVCPGAVTNTPEGDLNQEVAVATSRVTPGPIVEEMATQLDTAPTGRGDRVTFTVAEKHVNELVESALRRGGQVLEVLGRRADLETLFLTAVNQGAVATDGGDASHDENQEGTA